jgi:hypothetical protein
LLGIGSSQAAPINFTGNVAKDFPNVAGNGVMVTPDSAVGHAALPTWMTQAGLKSGMDFKDVRLSYDQATDTLSVGINFNGIGGDVDGNGTVGTVAPQAAAVGTYEVASFGNRQTVALGLDLSEHHIPDVIVGIPVNKPIDPTTGKPETGVQAFTMATYKDSISGLAGGFGDPNKVIKLSDGSSAKISDLIGTKTVQTSASSPDIEFQIKHFSDLVKAFNPNAKSLPTDIGIQGYSADIDSYMIGKSILSDVVKSPLAERVVPTPEPTTILAWSAVLGLAAAWRLRRARRAA